MPKAEVGSTKFIANRMKAKGLQRLRWYCQICEKQCRDENGFKQHTMSEGHVRAMLQVGEDPRKYINEYSNQFKRDFLQLLKTAHGEKKVHMNNFYQEYIRDKEHIHMNSTKWPSLTEFAKFLGREGLCRVEEGDKGLEIAFIDDSPDAVKRREAIKQKEQQAQGEEESETRMLEAQMKRARAAALERAKMAEKEKSQTAPASTSPATEPTSPVKVSFSLGSKGKTAPAVNSETGANSNTVQIDSFSAGDQPAPEPAKDTKSPAAADSASSAPQGIGKVSLSLAGKSKPLNPLKAKKNPLCAKKEDRVVEPEKKMSNLERIMREDMERKRLAEQRGHGGAKRQRFT